jgi:hypothetical protein
MTAPRYLIALEPKPWPGGPRDDRRLAAALKSIGRRFRFRCTVALEAPPVDHPVTFVLDGLYLRPPAAYPFVPARDTVLVFGAAPDLVDARVEEVWWLETARAWEVRVERDSEYPIDAEEAARWRKAGFDVPDPPPVTDRPPWEEG